MKTRISKRVLSIILSALMLVSVIPFGVISAGASQNLSYRHTMIDLTFNNSWSDNSSSYYIYKGSNKIYYQSWGSKNFNSGDINFSDGTLYTDNITADLGTSDFSNSSYNKNWEISLDFKYYNSSQTSKAYIMEVKNSSAFFGLRRDGQIYYNGANLGSISFDTSGTRYVLTYAYNHGIVSIYMNNELKFVYDMGDDLFFEQITGLSFMGEYNIGTNWYIYGLVAESYQQDDEAAHLKGRYLVNDKYYDNVVSSGKSMTVSGSGISFTNVDGIPCAVFPDSKSDYLTLSSNKLANMLIDCNESSGFSLAFYGKSNNNVNSRFFDMTTGSAWNTDGAYNDKYLFFSPYEGAGIKARYASDGETSSVGPVSDSDTVGWHTWIITAKAGALTVYRDSFKLGSILLSNRIDVNWFTSMVATKLLVGASCWNDDAFDGCMRDLRIYDIALSSAQVVDVDDDIYQHRGDIVSTDVNYTDLADAMDDFEARVAEMAANGYTSLYTNIVPAYEAYKDAVDALATADPDDDTAVLTAFNSALNNMKPFTEAVADANPSGDHFSVSNVGSDYYYRNIIYSEGAQPGDSHGFDESAHCEIYDKWAEGLRYGSHAFIYYPNCVVLYDGVNNPIIPVVAGFLNRDNRYAVNVLYLDENVGQFDLAMDWWRGYDSSTEFAWPESNNGVIPTDHSNRTEYGDAWTPSDGDQTHYYLYKNALKYTTTPSSSYTCISSTTWEMLCQYGWLDKQNPGGFITNAIPDIVVIDYSRLTSALKTCSNDSTHKGWLGDLETRYQRGGLEGIFEAFDSATTLDPNTGSTFFNHNYEYSKDMDANALQCATDIDSSVILLNDVVITAEYAQYQDLCDAIEEYENTMNTMTGVHINLEAAYNAYVLAIEYRDAYEYGGRRSFESPNLAQAAQNLTNATARMLPYTVPEADTNAASSTGKIKYPNDSADVNTIAQTGTTYHQNIVYWGDSFGSFVQRSNTYGDMTNFSAVMTPNTGIVGVTYPTTVLLYDGETDHTPQMPVLASTHKNGTGNDRFLFFLYPTATNNTDDYNHYAQFELDYTWNGQSKPNLNKTLPSVSWIAARNETSYHSNKTDTYIGDTSNKNYIQGFYEDDWFYDDWYYPAMAANSMSYVPSNNGAGNTTDYYEKHMLNWVCDVGSDPTSLKGANDVRWAESSTPIYVINYKPLKDKINTISSNLTAGSYSVDNYKEGGLGEWLAKLDSLTSIDPNQYDAVNHPNGYDYASNPESATIECANDIKGLIGEGGTAADMSVTPEGEEDTQIVPGGVYAELKDAIDTATNDTPIEQGCIKTVTWNAYQDALQDARDAMAAIADDQSGTTTGKQGYTGSDIGALADALNDTIEDLYLFVNSEHPLQFSFEETDTHTGYFQCSCNNAHVLTPDAQDQEYKTLQEADMSAYDAAQLAYNSLDLSKYSIDSLIASGYLTYGCVRTDPGAAGVTAQTIVDNGIAAFINAVNTANTTPANTDHEVKNITVTFNVTESNSGTTSTATYTVPYGRVTQLDATSVCSALTTDNLTCYMWEIQSNEYDYLPVGQRPAPTKVVNQSNYLSSYIQSDVTITAFYSAADNNKIVFKIANALRNTIYTLNTTADTEVVIPDSGSINTVSVGGTDYTVNDTINYVVTGWRCGSTDLTAGTYTIAELQAMCKDRIFKLDPITQKKPVSDTNSITLDGVEIASNLAFDTRQTVSTSVANAYAIVINLEDMAIISGVGNPSDAKKYVPVAYGTSYEFSCISSMIFYTMTKENGKYYVGGEQITDESLIFNLDRKLPMSYSLVAPDATKTTRNISHNAFTTNCGTGGEHGTVTITECGTLFTPNALGTSQFVITNVDNADPNLTVHQAINPNNRDMVSNQYYYALNSSKTLTMRFRSYVKFTYEYEYNGNYYTFDAISYSDIHEANYPNA